MKLPADTLEKLKFAGGAIIVLAAAAIMFPGILSVAAGMGRLAIMIVLAIAVSVGFVHLSRFLFKSKKNASPPTPANAGNPDGTSS